MMRKTCCCAVALCVSLFAVDASAGVLTSAPFSLGYGFTPGATWNTTETSAFNTPTTQGNFTFTPVVTGGGFDGTGPKFTSRTLSNGSGDFSATSIAYSSVPGFAASITAAYTGPIPLDADVNNPNFEILFNISQVSIYGMNYTGFNGTTLAFTETTPGHTSSSPALPMNTSAPANSAAPYQQLVWNPDDFLTAGLSTMRSFALLSPDESPVDGFEVFGFIELHYVTAPVPEPASMALVAIGAVALLRTSRRSRTARGFSGQRTADQQL